MFLTRYRPFGSRRPQLLSDTSTGCRNHQLRSRLVRLSYPLAAVHSQNEYRIRLAVVPVSGYVDLPKEARGCRVLTTTKVIQCRIHVFSLF